MPAYMLFYTNYKKLILSSREKTKGGHLSRPIRKGTLSSGLDGTMYPPLMPFAGVPCAVHNLYICSERLCPRLGKD